MSTSNLPVSNLPVYNPAAWTQHADGIRRFDNPKLQDAIDDALKAVDGKTFAAVAHHVFHQDGSQVENITKVSLAVKLDGGWSLAAGAYKDWAHGDIGAEAKATWSI